MYLYIFRRVKDYKNLLSKIVLILSIRFFQVQEIFWIIFLVQLEKKNFFCIEQVKFFLEEGKKVFKDKIRVRFFINVGSYSYEVKG